MVHNSCFWGIGSPLAGTKRTPLLPQFPLSRQPPPIIRPSAAFVVVVVVDRRQSGGCEAFRFSSPPLSLSPSPSLPISPSLSLSLSPSVPFLFLRRSESRESVIRAAPVSVPHTATIAASSASGRFPSLAPSLLPSVCTFPPHCCRSGRQLDFGFQRQFQSHMNRQGVGFQGIYIASHFTL